MHLIKLCPIPGQKPRGTYGNLGEAEDDKQPGK
jgi:hypothetical protein